MKTRWVKIPSPVQFRGEGEWVRADAADITEDEWQWIVETNYLPTYEGDNPNG